MTALISSFPTSPSPKMNSRNVRLLENTLLGGIDRKIILSLAGKEF